MGFKILALEMSGAAKVLDSALDAVGMSLKLFGSTNPAPSWALNRERDTKFCLRVLLVIGLSWNSEGFLAAAALFGWGT